MARPLRIEYPGAVYHITSRGNAGKRVFKDDIDKDKFIETLGIVVRRFNWLCHAYCLMDNHYHLLIETPDAFGRIKRKAQRQYREFVKSGIKEESPWKSLKGQILLGGEGFIEKIRDLLVKKEGVREIPRIQRYVRRPKIADIFQEEILDKEMRDKLICMAHIKYGYTLKEIADYLGVHYTTVSKAIKWEVVRN